MPIGKLEPVPLRDLWAHEATQFTPWLAENLDLLGEQIGLTLTLVEEEGNAGDFSVDIVAQTPEGHTVIIENQLERTDHDHLGKLITYLSTLEAKVAIWISPSPRPEHERAIHWLNEVAPADTSFYLVKVEAFRIGDSPPAPLFTVIAGPSPEGRQIGARKRELAERHILLREFWTQLLERARKRTSLHARRKPTTDYWIETGAGMSGVKYIYVLLKDRARIELYIDTGDEAENKRLFDALFAHKDEIEAAFGEPLDWQRLDHRRASRIAYVLPGGGLPDQERWPQIQEAMIEAMVRFERAFKPHIRALRSEGRP